MKKAAALMISLVITFSSNSYGNAHGGGLDWQGGHNCRVGSCAGTYHCHQALAGTCATKVKESKKPASKKVKKG